MVAVPAAPAASGTDTGEVRRGRQLLCSGMKVNLAEDVPHQGLTDSGKNHLHFVGRKFRLLEETIY